MTIQDQITISEQFIIGAILKQPKAALTILAAQKVSPEWFQQVSCNVVMRAIFDLVKSGSPIEPATVLRACVPHSPDSQVTIEQMHHYIKMCSSSSYLLHHVGLLKQRRQRVELEEILDVAKQKLDGESDTNSLIEELHWMIHGLTTPEKTPGIGMIDEIMSLYIQSARQGYTGIPSRWPCLMDITGGYPKKGVTLVSGLSKHGKTTLACNELLSIARKNFKILFISMEMSEAQIRAVIAGDDIDIDLFKLRNGEYKGEIHERTLETFKKTLIAHQQLPITIIDGSKTISELDSLIRGAAGDMDMVIIDHFHLIRRGQGESSSKEDRLSLYSNTIANSAVDANVNIMLLAQLSRDGLVDHKGNPAAPEPRNLKGTGSLEQDASQVIFVYQDPQAGKDLVPDQSPTKIKVSYNRSGRVGIKNFVFLKSKQKFIPAETWEMHEEQSIETPF